MRKIFFCNISDFLQKSLAFFKKILTPQNLSKLKRIVLCACKSIEDFSIKTYNFVKNLVTNIFDLVKIKKYILQFFQYINNHIHDFIEMIRENTEKLFNNINNSKKFITTLFDQIREQGHISIHRDLDEKGPIDKDPGLFYTISSPNYSKDMFYPQENIDENFDLAHRQSVLKKNEALQKEMKKSVQEFNAKEASQQSVWKTSEKLNSIGYIGPIISKFEHVYNELENSLDIDENFIKNMNASTFIVNGNIITMNNNKDAILKDFKNLIPDSHFQKLIAAYSNISILNDSYSNLEKEYPELSQYDFRKSTNIYKVDNLPDGSVKISITNIADLEPRRNNLSTDYHAYGMRATIIASPYQTPVIKYSYFIK